MNHKLVEKFPNYLFGITNYAKELLLKDDAAKALTIIGEDLNIATRFPESEEFTRSEVANFQEIVFMYHLFEKNDVAKAKEALAMMQDADEDHAATERCEDSLFNYQIEQRENRPQRTYDPTKQTTKAPDLHFVEILDLYKNDLTIDHNLVKKILELPRKPLIEDLEKVVLDALYRYRYFRDKSNLGDYEDSSLAFPLHAIFLLTELQSKESLPVIWQLLQADKEVTEF